MQRRKSLGYNNFLIDTSMCAYISTDLSLLHIVPGCLWSLSLVNKYQAKGCIVLVKLHLILNTWHHGGSTPAVVMIEIAEKTQSQDFFGVLCPSENYITLAGSLPATSHQLSFLCRFPSTLHFYFLGFWLYLLFPAMFKDSLPFYHMLSSTFILLLSILRATPQNNKRIVSKGEFVGGNPIV